VYYVGAVIALFAPWSCIYGPTFWYAAAAARKRPPATSELPTELRAHRLLLCWFALYLVFFSLAATKLPNYVAPLYPALALLTARFLTRWRTRELNPPRWIMAAGAALVAVTGIVVGVALLVASGALGLSPDRSFPGLERWAWIGLVPVAAAAVMLWGSLKDHRDAVVAAFAAGAVGMIGLVAFGVMPVIDQYKSARYLVFESGARRADRDIRLVAVGTYFPESLVFYAERKVWRGMPVESIAPNGSPVTYYRPFTPDDVADLLALPIPVFVFVQESLWNEQLAPRVTTPYRVAASKYDVYRHAQVIVVTNGVP
jgi:4-amino-4-deoxy-L-arabinose transferase-like glycosyltransferase